ncbi:type II toxin-antitoxin system HicA family toxin [Patescibacteria group bacterium]|nr:type II toxin-antitoxin system HicA family toxin [Patescibacteria group bacterium]
MPKLPIISGKETIKKLEKLGYVVVRKKGSHVRLHQNEDLKLKPITIPLHKSLKFGLLHHILKDANLTIEDFIKL